MGSEEVTEQGAAEAKMYQGIVWAAMGPRCGGKAPSSVVSRLGAGSSAQCGGGLATASTGTGFQDRLEISSS
jgi:hypothetical protein